MWIFDWCTVRLVSLFLHMAASEGPFEFWILSFHCKAWGSRPGISDWRLCLWRESECDGCLSVIEGFGGEGGQSPQSKGMERCASRSCLAGWICEDQCPEQFPDHRSNWSFVIACVMFNPATPTLFCRKKRCAGGAKTYIEVYDDSLSHCSSAMLHSSVH